MKIHLGRTVMTRSIANMVESGIISQGQVNSLILKQMNCDWGETKGDDAKMNNEAARTKQGRILSSHTINNNRIWVITDFGNSEYPTTTTVLLPSDY